MGKEKVMKAKKIISFILAISMIAIALSGCNNKANDKDEQGRTVFSISGYPTKEGTSKESFDRKVTKFNENNPDAVVIPDVWNFELKTFYAKAAGNQLPNVFDTRYTEVAQCIDSGYVADITDALKKRGYEGKFNPAVLDIVTKDGKIYGFPYDAALQGLAINTELFEKAGLMEADGTPKQPKDWNELAEFAVKIKKATGKAGFVFPTSDNVGGWIFTCLAWSFGVNFMEQGEDGKWKAIFNSPEAAEALSFIKDLKWKYDVLPANALINYDEYIKAYATGNAAMMIIDTAVVNNVNKYGMTPEQIGMIPIPAGPKGRVSLVAGSPYMFTAESTDNQIDAGLRYLEMSYNYNATDDFKEQKERSIQIALEENRLVGLKKFSVWNKDTESVKFESELIEKNQNANPNHVRLYNEFIENPVIEIRPEEPVCAQELYALLDGCIQEVLTNKDADCKILLEKAASDFQANYLDNLEY